MTPMRETDKGVSREGSLAAVAGRRSGVADFGLDRELVFENGQFDSDAAGASAKP